MTSPLDDALDSAAPVFDEPSLLVTWKESPPSEYTGVENLYRMSDTLDGSWSVEQSFDDGLPDPVTMTGGADASGKLDAGLIGRQGLTFHSATTPSAVSGENAFASSYIGTSIPPGLTWGDLLVMAITVPSSTVSVDQGTMEGRPEAWEFVSRVSDGTISLWVYKKRYYPGMSAPNFWANAVVSNTVWACMAVGASDPEGRKLDWKVQAVPSTASASVAIHTQAPVASARPRSMMLGVWSAAGPESWTVNAPDTEIASWWSPTSAILMSRTPLYTEPTSRTDIAATRSVATDQVAMLAIVLEPFERPSMSPTQFWSPFNEDSPVYGRDRDTADIEFQFNTVTSEGTQPTNVFYGKMDDVTLGSGGDVVLSGSSSARMTLNKSVSLPIVFGRREGGGVDFLVAWLMARADSFIGPAPGPYTRWWVPCYGSLHGALDGPLSFYYSVYTDNSGAVNRGLQYPTFIEGPHHLAAFGCYRSDVVVETVYTPGELHKANEVWPWVEENYLEGQYLQDTFSFENNFGRMSFWIKSDPITSTPPSAITSPYLFWFMHQMLSPTGAVLGQVSVYMNHDRVLRFFYGSDAGGTFIVPKPGGLNLPDDGQWHFYSIQWGYDAEFMTAMRDGYEETTLMSSGAASTSGWYDTTEDLYAAGGRINTFMRSRLPISDIIMEAGYQVATNGYDDVWPTYPWPSFTGTTRASRVNVEATVDDTPVNAWETMAELAQTSLSWYRADEWDGLQFLPPSYWGEPEQQAIAYTVDTDENAQDLDVGHDASKSRNVVTVKFTDTKVDLNYSTVLSVTAPVPIPPGWSEQIFTLDLPVAEIHGAATPYAAVWTLTNLTSAQITAGTYPNNQHYMSVNTLLEGNGTVLAANSVTAKIVGFTQTTVTLNFMNKTGREVYLANNYQGDTGVDLPFLRIMGYPIRQSDGYVTVRDGGSIGTRRERSLDVEMPWLHDRATATQIASQLVSILARPRPEVTVNVMGDPRRTPGQLVQIADAEKTQAEGTWRVLSITHNADGPAFTQVLRLVKVPPPGVWDQTEWDDSAWGE